MNQINPTTSQASTVTQNALLQMLNTAQQQTRDVRVVLQRLTTSQINASITNVKQFMQNQATAAQQTVSIQGPTVQSALRRLTRSQSVNVSAQATALQAKTIPQALRRSARKRMVITKNTNSVPAIANQTVMGSLTQPLTTTIRQTLRSGRAAKQTSTQTLTSILLPYLKNVVCVEKNIHLIHSFSIIFS